MIGDTYRIDRSNNQFNIPGIGFGNALPGNGSHFRAVIDANDSPARADAAGQLKECSTGAAGHVKDGLPWLQHQGIHRGTTDITNSSATGVIR